MIGPRCLHVLGGMWRCVGPVSAITGDAQLSRRRPPRLSSAPPHSRPRHSVRLHDLITPRCALTTPCSAIYHARRPYNSPPIAHWHRYTPTYQRQRLPVTAHRHLCAPRPASHQSDDPQSTPPRASPSCCRPRCVLSLQWLRTAH